MDETSGGPDKASRVGVAQRQERSQIVAYLIVPRFL